MLLSHHITSHHMTMALPSERNKNNKSNDNNKSSIDEIEVVLRRFGDEQSTLLDQFERLSFEVQLNQAILRRCLSEPSVPQSKCLATAPPQPPVPVLRPLMNTQVRQGRRGSGFGNVLKKLLKPILGLKATHKNNNSNNGGRRKVKEVPDPKNLKYYKAFSKSLRF